MKPSAARRVIAAFICITLLLPFYVLQVQALDGPKVIIEIGQPAVWSLGQAHYLLAKMHRRNRKLATRFPDENDLDSNRVSATRIDALRQSLGIEGQFDQAMGVKNDLALQRFREGEVRRETARADLRARQGELQKVNGELAEINEQIAVLTEEDRQSKEARDRETPPAPPTVADNERRKQLALLNVRKTRKEDERTELKSQITSLTTTADTPTPAPTFEEPALTTGNGSLPNPATFQKFMDKALAEAGKPELSAQMKLDNFIGMQYEIIAKQLTLLRDEVGPDDRVIFLELPASIYTVDGKADNYIAQADWEVVSYYDSEPSEEVQAEVIKENLKNEGKKDHEIRETLLRISNVRDYVIKTEAEALLATKPDVQKLTAAEKDAELMKLIAKGKQEARDRYGSPRPYPITLEMIRRAAQKSNTKGKRAVQLAFSDNQVPCVRQDQGNGRNGNGASEGNNQSSSTCKYNVRAIDIIPRQSALNVNEFHATVKETMILAAFKFLIGFAGKVNFQRQRELYEQFVQQEVFASGYGKGGNKFGWTYGPQPGTKRIKTGQRTSFAVLVVPRNTLAIELKGRGRFFKRNESPVDNDDDVKPAGEVDYLLSVPGQKTQEFWAESISYVPVRKGKRVTAIIEGDFFSPQLGVVVNGVPLEPVGSISRSAGGDEEADVQSADGIVGEYEITSSRQIVLSFSMGDNYVGTPNITFTSPEKSTSINFFGLDINHRGPITSLQEHSIREPMFMGDFGVKEKLEDMELREVCPNLDANVTYLHLARLRGEGFRPGAQVSINDAVEVDDGDLKLKSMTNVCSQIKDIPDKQFIFQETTNSYVIYAKGLNAVERKLRYRQPTRQGYDEREFTEDRTKPIIKHKVRNYRFNPAMRRGEVDLTFSPTANGTTISAITLDDPETGRCLPIRQEGPNSRVKCYVPADNGGKLERDYISVKITLMDAKGGPTDKYEDIRLPVRPLVTSMVNPRTGYASGFVDEEPTLIISGVNLQGITGVLFGDKEVKVSATGAGDAIAVKVPKGPAVPKGQAVGVPIVLQTTGGQIPSGAVYTYLGEPLAPNIIVWPPPVPGKLP